MKDNYGRNTSGTGGYETIEGRIYRVDDGLIKSVTPGTQKIDSYTFRLSGGRIMLGDGREYVRHGEGITALATQGESLYYSVVTENGSSPVSQLWKLDVYTGEASPVTGSFPGKVTTMYPWKEEGCIFFEYRPGASGSLYGRIGVIDGNSGYVLEDVTARAGGFDGKNDLLQPVWTQDGKLDCYWQECSGASSDGTLNITDTRTLELSLSERSRLGGSGGISGPSFFGTNWNNTGIDSTVETDESAEYEEEEAETVEHKPDEGDDIEDGRILSEDEMIESAAASTVAPPAETDTEPAEDTSAAIPGPPLTETSPVYTEPTDLAATVEAAPGPTVSPQPAETVSARPADPITGSYETVAPIPGQ